MSSRCYTIINGQYEPINATASSGVRCMTCNNFFDPNDLEEHLNTHILPSYQKNAQKQIQTQKVKFNILP